MTTPGISDDVRRAAGPVRATLDRGATLALRKAASRAVGIWRNSIEADVGRQEGLELSAAIVNAIVESGRGPIDTRLQSAAGRRLLDLVYSEVVHAWREGAETPSAGEMLDMLDGIDSVRARLTPGHGEQFAHRLAAPDGLELVVEIATDLRSPLTAILFLADTMQRRVSGDITELQHRQLGLIYSAALGLSEMATNVVELMKGGSRLVEDKPSPFSVSDLLESVFDIVRPMAEEKGLLIRLTPPENPHRVGHPLALSRVLLNLTTNALKFTEQGVIEIMARETATNRVEFSVRDSGPGISPTALDTLYSPFRPVTDGPGSRLSGTGLGLALCRRLADAMGSELRVESEPGRGTRFHVEIDLPPVKR